MVASIRPAPSSPEASRRMKRVRQKNTSAESALRREPPTPLGHRYRIQVPVLTNPRRVADVAFGALRVAVFVDGCFWHGCPKHATWPKQNAEFLARASAKIVAKPSSATATRTRGRAPMAGRSCACQGTRERRTEAAARSRQDRPQAQGEGEPTTVRLATETSGVVVDRAGAGACFVEVRRRQWIVARTSTPGGRAGAAQAQPREARVHRRGRARRGDRSAVGARARRPRDRAGRAAVALGLSMIADQARSVPRRRALGRGDQRRSWLPPSALPQRRQHRGLPTRPTRARDRCGPHQSVDRRRCRTR